MSNQSFKVVGGKKLKGAIIPQGAKNETLQILCATLLTSEKVTIANVPDILDVQRLIALLKGLGVEVNKVGKEKYTFQAKKVDLKYFTSDEYQQNAKSIRGSVMLIGPLLARYGKGFLPQPGGDKIGRRRLDTHFLGLQKLGAVFNYDDDKKCYFIEGDKLKGTYILMDEISVTGTANVVMAAVMAKGTTQIYNACLLYTSPSPRD